MKTKLTHDEIRGLIKAGAIWFGFLIVWRIVTMLLWSMFFGSTVQDEADYDVGTKASATVTILSSLVSMVVLAVTNAVIFARNNGDERRALVEASREDGFSLMNYFKKFIPVHIVYVGLYVLTQLIFCGFFAAFGFRYVASTGGTVLERFHIADAGFYLLTNNALLGLLLNIIVMTLLLCGTRLFVMWRWQRDRVER
ncbi:MAG: hypothetical protein IJY27_06520 [Clostridia bacterium]|nr:hypothetical protein [Clostridia bacterium]